MEYSIQDIAKIIHAELTLSNETAIAYLLIDSRKIVFPQSSLFFAISSPRRDGHQFVKEVYERGVRNFVVKKGFNFSGYANANFLQVTEVVDALQQLATHHRSRFSIPVIGITGSNGKTIVKEWLNQLLQADYNIVRSPRSYNSQIGVPLSIWQMNEQHTLGIFEAGISTINEMSKLATIIQPTKGVLTNIAEAHSQGFENNRQKAIEKLQLFAKVESIVFGKETLQATILPDSEGKYLFQNNCNYFSWSRETNATLQILSEEKEESITVIYAKFSNETVFIKIPFTDRISIDNAITCWCVLLQMNYESAVIQKRMMLLEPIEMRMQLKKAINNCFLLNDSYSNDLSSLDLAIEYLQQQAGNHKTTLVLSDILQSGQSEETLYKAIATQLSIRGINRLIGIGPAISKYQFLFKEISAKLITSFYESTDGFLQQTGTQQFKEEYILLKGARIFEFEKISAWLEQKVHQTVMEINLSALVYNLKEYQNLLKPLTKLMAVVKAFSYGSGSAEVARVLQFHKVDYLAVAYADEGVELRKAGISLPIMVMNADKATFDTLITFNLEPEIYSFPIYHAFHYYLLQQGILQFPIHIKFNTGMNRLGFEVNEAIDLGVLLYQNKTMAVKTVFTHLTASENPDHDAFTKHQVDLFINACKILQENLNYTFIKHLANSSAISRHPEYQLDMVRLGIGLYGVKSDGEFLPSLHTVTTLKSTIAQVRNVKAGETIGYGRKGQVLRDSLIATIRIGYADGFSRKLGNGNGSIYLNGHLAPVIGEVCMDMTMIDVTDIAEATEGDEVEIFGKNIPIQQLAIWAKTIPYEVMTGISQRVKRVYFEE